MGRWGVRQREASPGEEVSTCSAASFSVVISPLPPFLITPCSSHLPRLPHFITSHCGDSPSTSLRHKKWDFRAHSICHRCTGLSLAHTRGCTVGQGAL